MRGGGADGMSATRGTGDGKSARPARARFPRSLRENIEGYLFISPWLFGFFFFVVGTSLLSAVLSFTNYDYLSPARWVGLANYTRIFTGQDPNFWGSVLVTFKYVFIREPLKIAIAFMLALFLGSLTRAVSFFRTLLYLPSIFGSGVAISIMWRMIFESNGLVNKLLGALGIAGVGWLSDPNIAFWTITLASLFSFGGTMLIFLAGLKGIPESLYEAATIDGAGSVRKMLHITIPMITPVIFFNVVMGIIYGFQTFTGPFVITNGGPMKATSFYMINLYENAFRFHHAGYASALAWILFVIILAFTLLVFKSSELWVFSESASPAAGRK
jgi:multiple sugar transport system permease protein